MPKPSARARLAKLEAKAKRSAAGRPSKYEGEKTVAKVLQAARRLMSCKGKKAFLRDWGLEQLAVSIGVCRDTINEWTKTHPEFSVAIKSWETARNAAFYRMPGILPNAIWIMGSKNILGWSDKVKAEHTGEGGGPITLKVITAVPRPPQESGK